MDNRRPGSDDHATQVEQLTELQCCIFGLTILIEYDKDGDAMVTGHSDAVHVNLLRADQTVDIVDEKDKKKLATLGWKMDVNIKGEFNENCWYFRG